ncbi:MAG: c-type cytochrome [Acidimicrobiia bacterium]|nr:c-type cytochrome [Acidimicrobiia bacterium]
MRNDRITTKKGKAFPRSSRISRLAGGASLLALAMIGCSTQEVAKKPKEEAPKGPVPYKISYPLGLDPESANVPKDNPLTEEKIKLGKRLYFENKLSVDGSISCASCHIPEKGFADPAQFSTGVGGKKGGRQAPTVINRLFSTKQFWDGRAASLEEQALGPVQNPAEMAMPSMDVVKEKLGADPSYVSDFKAAFPPDGAITDIHIAQAIASFERTVLSGNSPYDRFIAGDKNAMSESAQRGHALFKDPAKGNCETCHVGFNFTDENYNNIGVGMAAKNPDLGYFAISKLEGHKGAFKTPTLREIASTAPYMHDGSQKTLEEVVSFYNKGGHKNKWLSTKIKPLNLSKQEQSDLVEFLEALSGDLAWYGK